MEKEQPNPVQEVPVLASDVAHKKAFESMVWQGVSSPADHRAIAQYFLTYLWQNNLIIINSGFGYFLNSETMLWENLETYAIGVRVCDVLREEINTMTSEMKKWVAENGDHKDAHAIQHKEYLQSLLTACSKLYSCLGNDKFIASVIKIIATLKSTPEYVNLMDNHHNCTHLLPMASCPWVINLRTGDLEERTGGMCFTKTIPLAYCTVHYDRNLCIEAKGEEDGIELYDRYTKAYEDLSKAISEIFNDNAKHIAYNKKIFGLFLTGEMKEKIITILYGPSGGNGKSLIFKMFEKILGRFCEILSRGFMLRSGNSSSNAHTAEFSSLIGVRLAIFPELHKDDKVNCTNLKTISGGDAFFHRPPNGKTSCSVHTPAKIAFACNNPPNFSDGDKALWNRSRFIKCPIEFVDEPKAPHQRKMNKDITDSWPDKKEYQHAFLRYCIEGAISYYAEGITEAETPEEYLMVREELRESSDIYQTYIDECIEWMPYVSNNPEGKSERDWNNENRIQSSALFDHYKNWLRSKDGMSAKVGRQGVFNEAIKIHGSAYGVQHKKNNVFWFYPLAIKQSAKVTLF